MRLSIFALALVVCAAVCTASQGSATPQVWQFPLYDDADDLTAFLIDGWMPKAASESFVWINDAANIGLSVRRAGAFAALLEGRASEPQARLRVSLDGQLIGPPDVMSTTFGATTTLPIGTLAAGEHRLRLEGLYASGIERAPRMIIAVRRLTITRVGG
jgi:hypothetical protein